MMAEYMTRETERALRPDALTWGWGMDVMLALALLMLLNALALGAARPVLFKAKGTEALVSGGMQRYELVEHYAMTGEWRDAGGNARRQAAAAAPSDAKPDVRGAATTVRTADGVIVMQGRYPAYYDGVATITLRPVVAKSPEPPTVRWLCGHAATPPGWHGPQSSIATSPSGDYLYSLCRKGSA